MGEEGVGELVIQPRNQVLEIFLGFAMCAGLHVAFYFVVWAAAMIVGMIQTAANLLPHADIAIFMMIVGAGGIPVLQLLYVIPMVRFLRRKGAATVAKGLIIGASLTFLLSASCWGWFLIMKPRVGG